MKALVVAKEYRDTLSCALVTFKHQLVYCPLRRKQVRLYPLTPEVTEEQLHYAGDEISEDIAYQLALGNYDPFSMEKLHDFDPDFKRRGKTNSWHEKSPSMNIWSKDYKVTEANEKKAKSEITNWPETQLPRIGQRHQCERRLEIIRKPKNTKKQRESERSNNSATSFKIILSFRQRINFTNIIMKNESIRETNERFITFAESRLLRKETDKVEKFRWF